MNFWCRFVVGFDRGVAPHTNCVSREGVFPKGWGGGRGEGVLSASCSVVLWWWERVSA